MAELQVVVLVVAGSSPVDHPIFYFTESHSRSRVTFVNMLKKSRAFFLVENFVVGAGETGIQDILDGIFHSGTGVLSASPINNQ